MSIHQSGGGNDYHS